MNGVARMSAAHNSVQTAKGVSIENGMEISKTDGAEQLRCLSVQLAAVLMGCTAEVEGTEVGLQLFN